MNYHSLNPTGLIEDHVSGKRHYLPLYRHLDTNGDGTGTVDANGDYSSAATHFYIQPPKDRVYTIARMMVEILDTNGFQAQEYGNLGSALTNGIQVCIIDDTGVVVDLTSRNDTVVTNAEWAMYCFDVKLNSWGAGDEQLAVRWTFDKAGSPLILEGKNNERLAVILNDNFTGLIKHHFVIQGLNFGPSKKFRRKDR